MQQPYPLRFAPLYRRYLWGGRRLETTLGKALPPGDDYAESWEIVDHGADQSVVAHGPLKGRTLQQLVQDSPDMLLGRHAHHSQFPLLFKFLDAHRDLSVQVHPNDEQAARLDPPDLGKTEAWVVVDAEPGSKLYAGLKRGFDRDALARELSRGTAELCLHQISAQTGDCVFVPAGTVHALGAGLVIAEIQQASDTTYRLCDWNRIGPDGQPRPLHIQEALPVIDYQRGPVDPQSPQPTENPVVQRLVECDKFVLDRWQISQSESVGGDDRFHILATLSGSVLVQDDPSNKPLALGETMLVPAAVGPIKISPQPDAVILDAYLP